MKVIIELALAVATGAVIGAVGWLLFIILATKDDRRD